MYGNRANKKAAVLGSHECLHVRKHSDNNWAFLSTFVLNCSLTLLWKLSYCKALTINFWLGPNDCANLSVWLWWGSLVSWRQAARCPDCTGVWEGNRCSKKRVSILEEPVTRPMEQQCWCDRSPEQDQARHTLLALINTSEVRRGMFTWWCKNPTPINIGGKEKL